MMYTSIPRPRALFLGLLISALSVISYLSLDVLEYFALLIEPVASRFTSHKHDVLLVSAFFPLEEPPQSSGDHLSWVGARFLHQVDTHIYFFTAPDMADTITDLRGGLPMTLNTSFSSPFDIPPLLGLEAHYARMHGDQDAELYALLSSKVYFLDEGLKNMLAGGHRFRYAFWNDAGSFKDGQAFRSWPDRERVEEIWEEGSMLTQRSKHHLLFFPIWNGPGDSVRDWEESDGPAESDDVFTEGAFFGGSRKAIAWLRQVYYAYHDYYIFKLGVFVGKDETMFNSLFLLFPRRFITVWQQPDRGSPEFIDAKSGESPPVVGKCGGAWWYYYQFFVAGERERSIMKYIWNPPIRDWAFRLSNNGSMCRLTSVLSMDEVLSSRFGPHWSPPLSTIDVYASQRSS